MSCRFKFGGGGEHLVSAREKPAPSPPNLLNQKGGFQAHDFKSIQALESELAALHTRYSQAQGQRELLQQQCDEKEQQLTQAQADIDLWRQVQVLLGKASEFARQQLKTRIEQTVTAALAAIFNDSTMKFEVEMSTIGGKPAADWRVVSCYEIPAKAGDEDVKISAYTVVASPEDAKGGGVTDVVSLALRLALLELSRPRPGRAGVT